jgi:putative membrane protein
MDYSILPHINAMLNATSGLLLLAGFYFITRRRITAHLRAMTSALVVSCIFLVSYLFYHYNHGSTRFTGQGYIRPVYFFILLTHTILAAAIVPLVAVTLRRAWRGDFGRHRRIARWTFPLWLYVSATGVVVYLMLYQLYPSR